MKERLLKLIDALGMNVLSFSKYIGVSDGTTRMYTTRGSKPGSDYLEKIILANDRINIEWLLTGRGEMFRSDSSPKQPTTALVRSNQIIHINQDNENGIVIPMIDQKAAANYLSGYTSQQYYNELAHTTLPAYMAKGGLHFWLQVKGDSMETTFYDGDWLLCEQIQRENWLDLKDFDVHVVVSNDRGVQVKRIKNRLKKGFIRCRSDNRAHKPYSLPYDDILEIWRVKWYLSNYMPNRNEDLFNKVDVIEENVEDLRVLTESLMRQVQDLQKQKK
ncbi:transcriptional regulator [Adhaeribacter aerolatus]|uniref:Transcriptional regulator n=1 Tax=Adhaeribacter aerolatus TaxID=670289 RepID=A0A512B3B2_9BACT|nr:S24 family peptidase [Adhaeribacter aerolatus]GEO06444.1 transcriptional regulator [Adhaeribacter aerolatus]